MSLYGALYSLVTGRSSKWPAVRRAHLKANPKCVVTGQPATDVHHIKPFHVAPSLELEPTNLASMTRDAHFIVGHNGNWKKWSLNFWYVVKSMNDSVRGPVGDAS